MEEASQGRNFTQIISLVKAILARCVCVVVVEVFADGEQLTSVRLLPSINVAEWLYACTHAVPAERTIAVNVKWFEEFKYFGSVDSWMLSMLWDLESKLCDDETLQYFQLRRLDGQSMAWHRSMQSLAEAKKDVLSHLSRWQKQDGRWSWFWFLRSSGSVETQLFTRQERLMIVENGASTLPCTSEQQDCATLSRSSNPFDE